MKDRLFYNCTVIPMSRPGETFEAFLVRDGKVCAVFPRRPDGVDAEPVDLSGAFVFPGFIDTHTHSFEGGLYSLAADLSSARCLGDLFRLLETVEPVEGRILAWRFDEADLDEGRNPTLDELDRHFPDAPLLIRRVDGHSCLLNSAAWKRIPWGRWRPDPRRPIDRRRNGIATRWFHSVLDDEAVLAAYGRASDQAARRGVTTVHAMIGNGRRDPLHYRLVASHLSRFAVEFVLYPQVADVAAALELSSPRIGGCLLADGSLGSRTAALLEPYTDRPRSRGAVYRRDGYWKRLIGKAHSHGLQVAVHAIGDAAVSQMAGVFAAVQRRDPRDLRHAIIHCELLPDSALPDLSRSGVHVVAQPMFDRLWGGTEGLYARRLGPARALLCNRLATLVDAGIPVAGSSDWYVTALDALAGIDAAVRLRNPEERLTACQAVELYTTKAAALSSDEGRLGRIAKGYQADFTCLDGNPLSGDNIGAIEVLATYKAGRCIYSG